jgi:hypothetical protein
MSLDTEDQKDADNVILQRNFGTDEEFCACLIEWQKAFDSLNGPD